MINEKVIELKILADASDSSSPVNEIDQIFIKIKSQCLLESKILG